MKNRIKLAQKIGCTHLIPLLVLFIALFVCPKINACEEKSQPKGDIITVSGYVISQGEPVADVLIDAASTNNETISDKEGKFSINVVSGSVIIFQKDGYIAYEYVSDEPRDNLIVCLQIADETDDASDEVKKEQEKETEAVLIIQTKKEDKKD